MNRFTTTPYEKSLGYRFPILSKEWEYKRNPECVTPETVRPYSLTLAWWTENHIHKVPYRRTVKSRVVNIPKVDNKPEEMSGRYNRGSEELLRKSNLLLVRPEISAEWDYEKNYPKRPEDYLDRSGVEVWWKCVHGHSWKARISNRTVKLSGCPVCYAIKKKLHYSYPEIAKTYNTLLNVGVDLYSIPTKSNVKVWWHCDECGNDYEASPRRRVEGYKCPNCYSNRKPLAYENSLAYHFPEIAAEWHPAMNGDLSPDKIRPKVSVKVWWQCKKHPEHPPWKAYVHLRTSNGTCNCPTCRAEKKRGIAV